MGNHKGRSKGCKTCIQRRVKCDQTEPTCLRCSKSKIICLGYRDCFVNSRQRKPRSRNTIESRHKSRSSQMGHSDGSPASVQGTFETPHMLGHQSLHIYHSLSVLPCKDDMMISYLIKNSRAGPMTIVCHGIAASNASESAQRTTTKQCLLALATALYGIGHSQRSLILDGRQLYGQALNMVTKMVHNPQGLRLTEAMASIYALSLFETISPTRNDHNSWLHHIFGLEQLFRIHGPFLKTPDPLFEALLTSTRLIMIVAALHDRRPSLMAMPEWSAVASHSHHDDPALFEIACTLDTLSQLTILYPERDELVSSPQISASGNMESSPTTQSLLERTLNLLANIQCRRARWLKAHPLSECFIPPPAHVYTYSSRNCPFKETLHFTSIHAANSSILYHTAVILIHQFAASVCQLLPASEQNVLEDCLGAKHISSAVGQILKSIDYHVQSTRLTPSSGSASFYLLLPLRVSYQALAESQLPQHVSWRLWLADIFSMAVNKVQPWTSNKQLFNLTSMDDSGGDKV